MKITKDIFLQKSVDVSIQRLCKYWQDRGMKFVKSSETYLKGKRGNLLGNLLSFNMKHIISQIEIEKKSNRIECNLSVNTILQHITESNRSFFVLELETFEKYLLSNDLNEKAWVEQQKKSTRQDISFTASCFLYGFLSAIVIALLF